jgi:hypothetical protein
MREQIRMEGGWSRPGLGSRVLLSLSIVLGANLPWVRFLEPTWVVVWPRWNESLSVVLMSTTHSKRNSW